MAAGPVGAVLFEPPSGATAIASLFMGSLSILSCLVVFVGNSVMTVLKQPPGRFVRTRTLFTLAQTVLLLSYAAFTLSYPLPRGVSPFNPCDDVVAALHARVADIALVTSDAIETGIAYFQLAQAAHVLFIVRDPFRPLRVSLLPAPSSMLRRRSEHAARTPLPQKACAAPSGSATDGTASNDRGALSHARVPSPRRSTHANSPSLGMLSPSPSLVRASAARLWPASSVL